MAYSVPAAAIRAVPALVSRFLGPRNGPRNDGAVGAAAPPSMLSFRAKRRETTRWAPQASPNGLIACWPSMTEEGKRSRVLRVWAHRAIDFRLEFGYRHEAETIAKKLTGRASARPGGAQGIRAVGVGVGVRVGVGVGVAVPCFSSLPRPRSPRFPLRPRPFPGSSEPGSGVPSSMRRGFFTWPGARSLGLMPDSRA